MPLPDFLIIGAMKAATTSLYSYLTASNIMALSRKKEVDYFNKHYYAGIDWYKSQFMLSAKKTGEASPLYIQNKSSARRIKETLPDVKLIAILRDPIDRAYSHYMMQYNKTGYEIHSFDYAVRHEEELCNQNPSRTWTNIPDYNMDHTAFAYKRLGEYVDQIMPYIGLFGDNLLILQFEDLINDPYTELEKIHNHIGIHSKPELKYWKKLNFNQYQSKMKPETFKYLQNHFKPYNERLYKLLGKDLGWK